MLKEISIKNFAIIDDLQIEFHSGLNLLTGETGSGKSIIIDALGILLGGRSNKNLIRQGKDKAFLEALFFINQESINDYLKELGYFDEDSILIISREISKGQPSISRINGRPVTLSVLNEISSRLVDIYGQFEHQSLLNISNHMKIIDSFGDSDYHKLLTKISKNYIEYKDEIRKLREIDIDSMERQRQIDLLKFQIDEIDQVDLDIDENDLIKEFKRLDNAKNIMLVMDKVMELLNGYGNQNASILDMLNEISTYLNEFDEIDDRIKHFNSRVDSSLYEIQDLWNEVRYYNESLYIDEEKLAILNEEIDNINKLKRKYGNTISRILAYRKESQNQYESLLNYDNEIEKRKLAIGKYKKLLLDDSLKVSSVRKSISIELENLITDELDQLNMKDVKFKVNFKEKDISSNGIDHIEFMIATNKGEDLKPLSKIVSGGEMSRIMLAFKSITASKDSIPTLVFDEIDTGISGRTAQIVGEKISSLAINHQIIIISHLPQIAALSDHYYQISKSIVDNKTITKVKKLTHEDKILELARLLGGSKLTEITLKNAKEMIEMSKKNK